MQNEELLRSFYLLILIQLHSLRNHLKINFGKQNKDLKWFKVQNQHEKCLVIQLTWCYFSRDFEKLVFAPFLANIMAKYICSKNIGLTICALFSLSVTILILLLNLIRLGHEVVDQKEDKDKNNLSSEKFGFDKSSKDEIMNLKLERIGSRYWEDILHQLLDNKSGRNNQDWTNSDKMVDEKTRGSMMKD